MYCFNDENQWLGEITYGRDPYTSVFRVKPFDDKSPINIGNIMFRMDKDLKTTCREEVFYFDIRNDEPTYIYISMNVVALTSDTLLPIFTERFVRPFTYGSGEFIYHKRDPITTNWDLMLFRCAVKHRIDIFNGEAPDDNFLRLLDKYEENGIDTYDAYNHICDYGLDYILDTMMEDMRMCSGIVSLSNRLQDLNACNACEDEDYD